MLCAVPVVVNRDWHNPPKRGCGRGGEQERFETVFRITPN